MKNKLHTPWHCALRHGFPALGYRPVMRHVQVSGHTTNGSSASTLIVFLLSSLAPLGAIMHVGRQARVRQHQIRFRRVLRRVLGTPRGAEQSAVDGRHSACVYISPSRLWLLGRSGDLGRRFWHVRTGTTCVCVLARGLVFVLAKPYLYYASSAPQERSTANQAQG